MRYYPTPLTRSEVDVWIAKCKRRYQDHGHGLWALISKDSGQLAGDCGLMQQMVDGMTETEVGYHFTELGKERVISLIRAENLPSCRVAERNGMIVEKEADFGGLPFDGRFGKIDGAAPKWATGVQRTIVCLE